MENVFPIRKNMPEARLEENSDAEISRIVEELQGMYPKLRLARTGLATTRRAETSPEKKAALEERVNEMDVLLTALSKFEVAHSRELKQNRIATMIRIAEENNILVTTPARTPTVEEAWNMVHRAREILSGDRGEAKVIQFPGNKAA